MLAFLAVSSIATAAPLSPFAREYELARALERLRIDAVIVPAGDDLAATRVARAQGLRIVELETQPAQAAGLFTVRGLDWGPLEPEGDPDPAADALLLQTSGTTSAPKAVALTHRNISFAAANTAAALELGPADRCLNLLPLFHLSGLVFGTLTSLASGGAVVSASSGFDPREFFRLLEEFAPTWFCATPTMLQSILARAPFEQTRPKRTSLRFIRSSAAALPPRLLAAVESTFEVPVLEAYSLTEAPGVSTNTQVDRKPGSVGKSLGLDLAVLRDDGTPLAAGTVGNITVRGPSVMRGYDGDSGPDGCVSPEGWFRTGDLGHLDADGRLYVTGRSREMINRGGEVIAPREIEEVLLEHPLIAEAAAFAIPDARLGEAIAVAVVCRDRDGLDDRAVRDFVAARLSTPKVPRRVIFVEALPKNAAGKVRRSELRAQPTEPDGVGPIADGPPQTPVEQLVATLWQEFFDTAGVRRSSNFFDYGGDSLAAARFVNRLAGALDIALPLHRFFEEPTVYGLAAAVEAMQAIRVAPSATVIPRNDTPEPAPLLPQQERLWLLHELSGETAALNLYRAIRIRGPLDVAALRSAIAGVVARHAPLRARFPVSEGVPRQAFDAAPHVAEYRRLDATFGESRLGELVAHEARTPFDLAAGPPFRSAVLGLTATDHVLVLCMHHLVADRWSLRILLREIAEGYRRLISGHPIVADEPAVRYSDFAWWQQSRHDAPAAQRAFAYWSETLAGPPAPSAFPVDHRSAQRIDAATSVGVLDRDLAEGLRALARSENATPFMALLGVFGILLSRYCGRDDVVVGVPVAGRSAIELEQLIGLFVNAVPVRLRIDANRSFREFLQTVRSATLQAHEHQEVPYPALTRGLKPVRSTTGSPFFQTIFTLQNTGDEVLDLPGLTAEIIAGSTAATAFDFNFVAYEQPDGVACVVEYNPARYDAETIERVLEHFRDLASAVLATPERAVAEIDVLDDDERGLMVHGWNATTTAAVDDRRLDALFADRAREAPEQTAVVFGDEAVSYGELDARANRLARILRERGVAPGDRVGLCASRSVAMISALLAIMKAGAVCVPLDRLNPPRRLQFMIEKAAPALVITETAALRALPTSTAVPLLVLDREAPALPAALDDPPPAAGNGRSLAYILFTSGSTGEPQGVMLEHRGFVNYVERACIYGIRPGDRVLQFTALNFDVSAGEIWSTLCGGATLCLRDDEMISSPAHFMERCQELGVSVLILPTAYFHELAPAVASGGARVPDGLRVVAFAGEAVHPHLVKGWLDAVGDRVRLVNHYGPTEATIAVTSYACNDFTAADEDSVSIGKPVANMRCYILDGRLRPVPIGVTGELWLAGIGLARGYLDNPGRTAERFVADPFVRDSAEPMYRTGDLARYRADGSIEFLGRVDHQVKVRGFRIELGEVESVLARHPDIRECAVVAPEDGRADKALVAYVAPNDGARISHREVRDFLSGRLPEHMLPGQTIVLDAFPLTSSGKIDRNALPQPERTGDDRAAEPDAHTENLVEAQVVGIFREILGRADLRVNDDFFDCGGHSLSVARLIAALEEAFGKRVTMKSVFAAPTPRALAREIIATVPAPVSRLTRVQDGAGATPVFFLYGDLYGGGAYVRHLVRALGPERAVYTLPPHPTEGPGAFATVETMAAEYAALIRRERQHGPYLLGGYCNGGTVAYEIARILRAQGETVGPVVLVASPAYNAWFRGIRGAVRGIARLLRWTPETEHRWYLRLRWRAIEALHGRWWRRRNEKVPEALCEDSELRQRFERMAFVLGKYFPGAYDGEVHLVWGDDEDEPPLSGDPTMGWGRVVSDLRLHRIAGNHHTMVTSGSGELGRIITAAYASWP